MGSDYFTGVEVVGLLEVGEVATGSYLEVAGVAAIVGVFWLLKMKLLLAIWKVQQGL